jgi:purine-binding chemotaxis protein CheW
LKGGLALFEKHGACQYGDVSYGILRKGMAYQDARMDTTKLLLSEVLIFSLDEHRYCLPARCVQEVVRAVQSQPVPNSPRGLEGIIDVHGTIVPVIDLRQRLGITPQKPKLSDHLIIIRREDQLIGIRVDRAIDVRTIEPAMVHNTAGAGYETDGFIRTQDGIVIVLDLTEVALEVAVTGPLAASIEA